MVVDDLSQLCLAPTATIREAMLLLTQNSRRIVLITDDARRLLGTITDGDIRRAILDGFSLDSLSSEVLTHKNPNYHQPLTAPIHTSPEILKQLMLERDVQQIPLLDEHDCVIGLVTLEDLTPSNLPLDAVIMAGGFGTRMRPLTENLPKPMLLISGQPIMERIIAQLHHVGIKQVNVTTHYKPEKIKDHFSNGSEFGININYVVEDTPLGTAGSLSLLEPPSQTVLVINGDILTQVDFRALLDYHREHRAALTTAVRQFEMMVPYGVVESHEGLVQRIQEKPTYPLMLSTGIYLLEPATYQYIPRGKHFDMPDLINNLIEAGQAVASFPILEYWLDIDQHADYAQAQQDVQDGKFF
jgi:dTDP-glucose pyrophosphorylase